MMAKLANTAWMQFIPATTGGTFGGMCSMIQWNSFDEVGSHPNDIHKWVGQNTLGRIYQRYRIINAITKFTFVPMVVSSNNTARTRYRGDVYFYVVQTDTDVDPVWQIAAAEFLVASRTDAIDFRRVSQIPGIKIKRRRWAEVPQSVTLTILNTMPQSTKVSKNPAYADDTGVFSGAIDTNTAGYQAPNYTLYTHFGVFLPTPVAYAVGDDWPSYKLQFKDITLCHFTDLSPSAGDQ